MADYYIDPATGNDTTGSGTSGAPWATLQKGVDNATGGDTIFLANTSADVLSASITWDTGFGTSASATPLTIAGWDNGGSLVMSMPGTGNDITVGVVDGGSTVQYFNSTTSHPAYVIFRGIRFDNFVPPSSQGFVRASTRWHFSNCEFAGITSNEYAITGGSGSIVNCWFHGTVSARGTSGFNGVIVGCFFQVKGYAANTGDYFVGNVVESTSTSYEPLVATTSVNSLVMNNTFIADGSSTSHAVNASNEETVVLNNIFYGFGGVGGKGISGSAYVTGYNNFYNCTTNEDTPVVSLGGNVTTDPSFADQAGGDYTPTSTDAIGGAMPLLAGTSTEGLGYLGGAFASTSTGTGATNVAAAKFTRLE